MPRSSVVLVAGLLGLRICIGKNHRSAPTGVGKNHTSAPPGYELVGRGYCTTSGRVPSDQPVVDLAGCAVVCDMDTNCKFISVTGDPLAFQCLVHRSMTCDTRQVSSDQPNSSHVFANKKHLAHANSSVMKEGAVLLGPGTCSDGVYDSISPGSPVACAAICAENKKCTFFSVGQREPYECVFYNSYSCDSRDVDPSCPDKHLTFVNTQGLVRIKAAVAKAGAELVGPGYCTSGVYNTTSPCTAANGAEYCSKDLRCKFFSVLQWAPFVCTLHDSTDCYEQRIISDPQKPYTALVFDMKKASLAMKFEDHDVSTMIVPVSRLSASSCISGAVFATAIGVLGFVSVRRARASSMRQEDPGALMELEGEVLIHERRH